MKYIDIRSDTVTQPTEEMRKAMLTAQVGDDVCGDDPTMNRLEALTAQLLGKEAALFVASGTMGNQIAIMTHTRRGDEIIITPNSHIFIHEVGAAAVLAGVSYKIANAADGIITPEIIEKSIRPEDIHYPTTSLVCLENPLAIGTVVPLATMAAAYAAAKSRGLAVHTDGARVFNAAAVLGVPASEIAKHTDSMMLCLSKGLCAPVGSMLVGTKAFIDRARKNRKLLGGGMRQAGFLAAAGILALEQMTARLPIDHANAAHMAAGLAQLPRVTVDTARQGINLVFFTLDASPKFIDSLPDRFLDKGIKIYGVDEDGYLRFVTSNDVSRQDVDYIIGVFAEILQTAY